MKYLILSIVLLFSANAFAQTIKAKDVPEPVKSKFYSLYPGVKKVQWRLEDSNYEGEFYQKKKEKSVVFDKDGNLLETETRIAVSSLPKSVRDAVKIDYPNHKIREAAKIESNGAVTY